MIWNVLIYFLRFRLVLLPSKFALGDAMFPWLEGTRPLLAFGGRSGQRHSLHVCLVVFPASFNARNGHGAIFRVYKVEFVVDLRCWVCFFFFFSVGLGGDSFEGGEGLSGKHLIIEALTDLRWPAWL